MSLPRLPTPPARIGGEYSAELAGIVFPDRARDGILKPQDHSDLLHLITAIQECAVGFITSEKAILKSAEVLRQRYGLEVVSPDAFGGTFEVETPGRSSIAIVAGDAALVTVRGRWRL